MKHVEAVGDYFPINETETSVLVEESRIGDLTSWTVRCNSSNKSLTIFDSIDLELPDCFDDYPRDDVHRIAAYLVQSRMVARLMASHLTVIHDDHAEAVTCLMLEQEPFMEASVAANGGLPELTTAYVQNWQQIAATRVTGALIILDVRDSYQHFAERPIFRTSDLQVTASMACFCDRVTTDQTTTFQLLRGSCTWAR